METKSACISWIDAKKLAHNTCKPVQDCYVNNNINLAQNGPKIMEETCWPPKKYTCLDIIYTPFCPHTDPDFCSYALIFALTYVIWIDRMTIWFLCTQFFYHAWKTLYCAHSFFVTCVREILAVDSAMSIHFNYLNNTEIFPFLGKN